MTITLVDSNVLLDIATEDPGWGAWSADALEQAADEGLLAINPLIYAEVSIGFTTIEDLDEALPAETYVRVPLPYEAAFLAGNAFLADRRRKGAKTAPLPDFYIGAHAAIGGYRLLTRDDEPYRTYFPTVPLLAP
ncbi:MAG: type II toxin-antitoxin system VapC family toxin [Natronosporangium sp.]